MSYFLLIVSSVWTGRWCGLVPDPAVLVLFRPTLLGLLPDLPNRSCSVISSEMLKREWSQEELEIVFVRLVSAAKREPGEGESELRRIGLQALMERLEKIDQLGLPPDGDRQLASAVDYVIARVNETEGSPRWTELMRMIDLRADVCRSRNVLHCCMRSRGAADADLFGRIDLEGALLSTNWSNISVDELMALVQLARRHLSTGGSGEDVIGVPCEVLLYSVSDMSSTGRSLLEMMVRRLSYDERDRLTEWADRYMARRSSSIEQVGRVRSIVTEAIEMRAR